MEIENKLVELLSKYIEENKKLKLERDAKITNRDLYEELLNHLSKSPKEIIENRYVISLLLNTIYGNDIYDNELYRLIFSIEYDKEKRKELKDLINEIRKDYIKTKSDLESIRNKLYRNYPLVSSAYRVRLNLKYHSPIRGNKFDIMNIKRIIGYFEVSGSISNKEELLLINEIELYNRRAGLHADDEREQQYVDGLYNEIPNILDAGFQKHDEIEVPEDRRETLDGFAKTIFESIPYLENEEIIAYIERHKKYNLSDNEYNYIIVKLLDSYLEELITFYELLIDKEIYTVRSDRIEIIKKYYQTLDKYLFIRNYYNKITEYEEEIVEEESTVEMPGVKSLIYAHNPGNITKTRLIKDMEDQIPHEYYETVNDLLTRFKNDELVTGELKIFTNDKTKRGYFELKSDQVRIILKHITGNIYCVIGAFAKKTDNDINMYRTIVKRLLPDLNTEEKIRNHLELAKYREQEISELIKEKSRKGNR